MELANPERENFSFANCKEQLDQVQLSYDDVKAILLHAGAGLRAPIPAMIDLLEQNSRIRRMARQMIKAMRHLSELYTVIQVKVAEEIKTVAESKDVTSPDKDLKK